MIINAGLYSFKLHTATQQALINANTIYGDAPNVDRADFSISLKTESYIRRWIRPQIKFFADASSPFKPMPRSQAYPLLEWGMNWCISAHVFDHLLLHAAVLVKNNKAIIFPALPGSGKSTLSAFLGLSGWTVYSDEMAVIDFQTYTVRPLYRPVCLKNNSIDIIEKRFPTATVTPRCFDTIKGTVAHVKTLKWSDYARLESVPIAAVVFPQYEKNAQTSITLVNQTDTFQYLVDNAFNYHVLGETGFCALSGVLEKASTYSAVYSDLADIASFLDNEVCSQ
ncbi:HprK-related kinase A [Aestuariibacter sp. AA17]|uniref:HprK-related kinase A n=1 Tax=Fluctibacter corallii TaxID=2984329 RepID=A0ABT3ABM7_9ALTE|nr:HprK-related kinase A [Aestuariibacter sp. AA17]MCV2886007.1 HprK-related kinase A [Aestuariibacter sp. AA17]